MIDFREILLEPPFIYQPKFKDLNDFSSLNSNFVIPVGDSLFNGNVKCSNGLHKHLPIINSLNNGINIILEKFNQLIENPEINYQITILHFAKKCDR